MLLLLVCRLSSSRCHRRHRRRRYRLAVGRLSVGQAGGDQASRAMYVGAVLGAVAGESGLPQDFKRCVCPRVRVQLQQHTRKRTHSLARAHVSGCLCVRWCATGGGREVAMISLCHRPRSECKDCECVRACW